MNRTYVLMGIVHKKWIDESIPDTVLHVFKFQIYICFCFLRSPILAPLYGDISVAVDSTMRDVTILTA